MTSCRCKSRTDGLVVKVLCGGLCSQLSWSAFILEIFWGCSLMIYLSSSLLWFSPCFTRKKKKHLQWFLFWEKFLYIFHKDNFLFVSSEYSLISSFSSYPHSLPPHLPILPCSDADRHSSPWRTRSLWSSCPAHHAQVGGAVSSGAFFLFPYFLFLRMYFLLSCLRWFETF